MIKNSRNVCHGFVSFFHFTGMKFGGLWGEEKEKLRKGSANDSSCKTCSCFCRRTLRFWFTSDCSPYFELSVWAGNNIPAYGLNYHKDILLKKVKKYIFISDSAAVCSRINWDIGILTQNKCSTIEAEGLWIFSWNTIYTKNKDKMYWCGILFRCKRIDWNKLSEPWLYFQCH